MFSVISLRLCLLLLALAFCCQAFTPNATTCENLCNHRSSTCDQYGTCYNCTQNTEGPTCNFCSYSYWGLPTRPCTPCFCNNHGVDCDSNSGYCDAICADNTAGHYCQVCAPGFFGNSVKVGGSCNQCSCNKHSFNCDPGTGSCWNCTGNTQGPQCNQCVSGTGGNPLNGSPCTGNGVVTGLALSMWMQCFKDGSTWSTDPVGFKYDFATDIMNIFNVPRSMVGFVTVLWNQGANVNFLILPDSNGIQHFDPVAVRTFVDAEIMNSSSSLQNGPITGGIQTETIGLPTSYTVYQCYDGTWQTLERYCPTAPAAASNNALPIGLGVGLGGGALLIGVGVLVFFCMRRPPQKQGVSSETGAAATQKAEFTEMTDTAEPQQQIVSDQRPAEQMESAA